MIGLKRFCYVTTPADWQVRFEDIRQFFWRQVVPLHRLPVRAQDGRPVIVPANLINGLLAVSAVSPPVPLLYAVPHQTSFRIVLNLGQALLPAVSALRPIRTLLQTDLR